MVSARLVEKAEEVAESASARSALSALSAEIAEHWSSVARSVAGTRVPSRTVESNVVVKCFAEHSDLPKTSEYSRQALRNIQSDPARNVQLKTDANVAWGRHVRQAEFAIAPLDMALNTNHLAICAALVVRDYRAGTHYLSHVDHLVRPQEIAASLSGFDLARSDIGILRGPVPSNVASNILTGLQQRFGTIPRLTLLKQAEQTSLTLRGLISNRDGWFNLPPLKNESLSADG